MKLYKNIIHALSIIFLLLPLPASAGEENMAAQVKSQASVNTSAVINADPMSGGYLLQLVFGLLVVLVCIIALAWFTKKLNRSRLLADDSLKIIAGLSMGTRERVVLLQVAEKQLLIGIAPGRINTLHVLDTPIATINNRSDKSLASDFSDKLKSIMASANNSAAKQGGPTND